MPTIKINRQPHWLRGREIKVVKRILFCIKGAKLGVIPGDKPARKAANFIACAPDYAAQHRRKQVVEAMQIEDFYYREKLHTSASRATGEKEN